MLACAASGCPEGGAEYSKNGRLVNSNFLIFLLLADFFLSKSGGCVQMVARAACFAMSEALVLLRLVGRLSRHRSRGAKKRAPMSEPFFCVSGKRDSNPRPLAPHASALPDCATAR